MSISYDAIYIILVSHALLSGLGLFDLVLVSKRKSKIVWSIVILSVPFLGAILYRATMTRSKRQTFFD
ncbi:MAG: hypothetical protein HOP30_16365 [Cyclobacteriaceae bacterium]|nr:hypothetical protein [Cyclobacteriaceae bacterium]